MPEYSPIVAYFGQEKIDNYLDPIVFTLSYSFAPVRLDRTNIFKTPVLEGAMTNKTTELYLKMGSKSTKDCIANLQLKPSVQINDEEVDTSESIELIDGLHQKVEFQIWVINSGEAAFNGKLNLTINNTLSLVSLDHSRCRLTNSNVTLSNIECDLDNPLTDKQVVHIVINPFTTFKPVLCQLQLSIANQLRPDSVIQESIIFRRVKHAAIRLKV